MLSRSAVLSSFSLSLLLVACGDDGPAPPPQPDAQFADMGDAGPIDMGPGDMGPSDMGPPEACGEGGPSVVLETPAAAFDPVSDEVIIGPFADVSCRVTRGSGDDAEPVDPESVVIEVRSATGEVLASPAVTAEGDLYRAQPNVGMLPNGPLTFRCLAFDTAEEPRCADTEVDSFVDNGPMVTVETPVPGSVHRSRILIRYSVEPAPLADGDSEADVASHTLVVAGQAITPTMEGGDFVADVDLDDRAVYPEPLSGAYELVITATNERTPEAATRRHAQGFTVDTAGPAIAIDRPASGELVGGTVLVEATITDDSGVDASTVVLRAAGMDFPMSRMVDTDIFQASFDASVFPTTVTELTLNITADDIVGNSRTVSLSVKLDAVAPILSLDPPQVREAKEQSGMRLCSELFDPVGADSANDGQVVGTTPELRVRAHDLANSSFGGAGTVIFYAGMDSVEVLVLDDTTRPLLVDLDSDGVCDAINPMVEPDPADPDSAVLIQMQAIGGRGSAFYSGGQDFNAGTPASAYTGAYTGCVSGSDTTRPSLVCAESSPLHVVIDRPDSGEAVIYGKPPVGTETCVGDSWDFVGAGVSEGWACFVARGTDNLGNVGVSPPLRLCLDDGTGASPCPAPVGPDPVPEAMRPSCTDGCTVPASFVDYPGLQRIGPAP